MSNNLRTLKAILIGGDKRRLAFALLRMRGRIVCAYLREKRPLDAAIAATGIGSKWQLRRAIKRLENGPQNDEVRYIVRATTDEDVVLRPAVIDTRTGALINGPWALNDWERAQTFADELNAIESGER